jgi:hypothetical protein
MHLITFFEMHVLKNMCHNFTNKYMKVKHQLELLYLEIDKGLMCMNIVSTFYIIVIIYQSFNVKVF